MFGISPSYYLEDITESNSPIINPSPKIHGIVSKDVYKQEHGDCAAFASARVLCKWVRTHNPQFFSNYDDIPDESVNDKYMDPTLFYNYETNSSNGIVPDFNTSVSDSQYTNICLFMLFYSKIVKQFGCEGSYEGDLLKYIITQISSKSKIDNFIATCTIDPLYCQHIEPVLVQNIDTNMIGKRYEMPRSIKGLILTNYLFRKNTEPNKHLAGSRQKLKSFFTQFFNIIRKNIKKSNYLTLSCDGILFLGKINQLDNNKQLTNQDILDIYDSMDEQQQDYRGHAVTIVDYDYSNPKNRQILIKNSWGKHNGMIMTIYESELSSPMLYAINDPILLAICWIESKPGSSRKAKSVPISESRRLRHTAKSNKHSY